MNSQKRRKEKENCEPELKREAETKLAELQVRHIILEMQNEELRKAQYTLEEIKERYIELYDFAPVGYFTFTRYGNIREVNLTGALFLGLTRQELLTRGFGYFVVPGDLELWDRHLLCTLDNWETQNCKLMLKREDGDPLFVRLDSIRMETKEGIPEIRTAMTDITHCKMEDEVRSFHNYTEEIMDIVHEPLIVLDEKLRVASANNCFYETFCVSPGETVGFRLFDIANCQWNITELRELLEDILPRQTIIKDIEVEHRIPSLGYRKLILNARRIPDKEGKTQFILLAMEDVTEHKPADPFGWTENKLD